MAAGDPIIGFITVPNNSYGNFQPAAGVVVYLKGFGSSASSVLSIGARNATSPMWVFQKGLNLTLAGTYRYDMMIDNTNYLTSYNDAGGGNGYIYYSGIQVQ